MKRIWFGIGLMILLLISGIVTGALVERAQSAQAEKLNSAAHLAADGDWAAARGLVSEVQVYWNGKQLLFCALFPHELMDQIDGLFAQLEVFSDARSATSFRSTCVYLASQLDALGKSHSLTLQNLF